MLIIHNIDENGLCDGAELHRIQRRTSLAGEICDSNRFFVGMLAPIIDVSRLSAKVSTDLSRPLNRFRTSIVLRIRKFGARHR
jgi:hypothetical protein